MKNMPEAVREGAKLSEEIVLRGFISPQEIRVVEVKGVVDTGATPLECRYRVGCSVEEGQVQDSG